MQTITIDNGNAINLRRLLLIRLIVLAGESLTVWFATKNLDIELPLTGIISLLGLLALACLLSAFRLRLPRPVSNMELFAQLTFDVLILTGLLYFTGGSTNPFAPLYLVPLILTAATLPAAYTWGMVLLTAGCYTLLLFFYIPLHAMHGAHDHGFRLHVVGMWAGFIFSAGLIAAFAARMSSTLRKQDQKIAELREQQLRQEQVLALGTLAAGAAHELGTPLATMAVLLKDMQADKPASKVELDTLRKQVGRCKTILGSISAAAGAVRAESGSQMALDNFLQKLIENWQLSRDGVRLKYELKGQQPAPQIVADQTLEQALINILNNAADASPDDVSLKADWTLQVLSIEVSDRGTGLAPDVADQAGESILSTKQDGLGLGLFLTYSTLERLGGQVRLHNRTGGGVTARVSLPLSSLIVSA